MKEWLEGMSAALQVRDETQNLRMVSKPHHGLAVGRSQLGAAAG